MVAQDFVLALLAAGEIPSRTMLQKLVYLAAGQVGEDVPFAPHFYGPYSSELHDEVEELVAAGLVQETAVQLEPWEPTSFDVVQYRYRLSDLGRAEVEHVTPRIRVAAANLVKTAHDAQAWDQASLSIAAKLHHIRGIDPTIGDEAVPELARQFGWRMSETAARRGARLLERIEASRVVHRTDSSE